MKKTIIMAAIAMSSLVQEPVTAQTTAAFQVQGHGSLFMRVYRETLPPIGYVTFCREHAKECRTADGVQERVSLTNGRRAELESINTLVNETVHPMTDLEVYGIAERWAYPDGRGDCEDYVLLKRKLLVEHGWPVSALLITVVRDENDEGHAVLTVRTAEGDFVLDNKRGEILPWNQTSYVYVKRQSYLNQQVWMSLLPAETAPNAALSSSRKP